MLNTSSQPLRYGFEAILANEFHTIDAPCVNLIPVGPGYENVSLVNQVCTTVGSVSGQINVDGNRFLDLMYEYSYDNLWRVRLLLQESLYTLFSCIFCRTLGLSLPLGCSSSHACCSSPNATQCWLRKLPWCCSSEARHAYLLAYAVVVTGSTEVPSQLHYVLRQRWNLKRIPKPPKR